MLKSITGVVDSGRIWKAVIDSFGIASRGYYRKPKEKARKEETKKKAKFPT